MKTHTFPGDPRLNTNDTTLAMNPHHLNRQSSDFQATRHPAPVRPSSPPWRPSVQLATFALVLGGFASTTQAALKVYEGFDYTVASNLNGLNGGTGFDGVWVAANTGSSPYNSPNGFKVCDTSTQTKWNGTLASLPQSGKYAGSPAPAGNGSSGYNGNNPDHMWAYRQLDASVTASFTLGSVTWMSFAQATNFTTNANGFGMNLAITPFSPPSGLAQRLFQEPPAKSKFLAVMSMCSFWCCTMISSTLYCFSQDGKRRVQAWAYLACPRLLAVPVSLTLTAALAWALRPKSE